MGAWNITVMLHDTELIEFVRQGLAEDATPEARYIAGRFCDAEPELLPLVKERGA